MLINKDAKHYFLYAKGWYKKSDNVFNDLKTICAANCKVPVDCIEEENVLNELTKQAFECLIDKSESNKRTIDLFQDFLFDLLPENNWRFYAASTEVKIGLIEAIVRKCLSIMMMQEVNNINCLDCDFSILPSSRNKLEDVAEVTEVVTEVAEIVMEQNISDFNTLAQYGVSTKEIADFFGFKAKTVKKHIVSDQFLFSCRPIRSDFPLLDTIDRLCDCGDNASVIANKLNIPVIVVEYVIEMC